MLQIILKIILIFSLFSLFSFPIANAEDLDLGRLFSDRSSEGTIVLSSLDGSTTYIHNKKRAEKRLLPCSTFKIPNTLIALDEGAVTDEKEIFKWDGKDKGWHRWNKDQTIETAFPFSCVWFYQELAKRVGNEAYLTHFGKLNYGNEKTGPDLTTFWLDGDLRISPLEQIRFLKKLYREELPFKKRHIQLVKRLMIIEKTPQYTLRAKTGWAMRIKDQYGWYIGYVEADQKVWFFAMNMDIEKNSDAAYRKEITMETLKVKGII